MPSDGFTGSEPHCDAGRRPRAPGTLAVVADLITGPLFLWGAGAGLVGLLLSYGLRRREPDWGLVWGAAVVTALAATGFFRGGLVGSGPRGASSPLWHIAMAVLAVMFAAYGIQRLRTNWVGAIAVTVTIGGIWATVPDTERAAILIGVTAALAWAWWPTDWASPRFAGSLVIGLLLAWVALRGGEGRETGLLGALGSMTMLGWSAFALPQSRPGLVLLGHVALVAVWSRWAGLSTSSLTALAIGVSASVAVALVLQLVNRLMSRQA